MNPEDVLDEIGLTKGESKTYLALLALGTSTVSEIQKQAGLHRTNIYEFLDKLNRKGLVSYCVEKSVHKYTAMPPENLKRFLDEKRDMLESALPDFTRIAQQEQDELVVEVFKGVEGIKMILEEVIANKKTYYCLGVDELFWEQTIPNQVRQFFRRQKELGLYGRLLTSEKTSAIYSEELGDEYRFLAEEYFTTTPEVIYGDTVAMILEPTAVLFIRNKKFAQDRRKGFETMWQLGKKHIDDVTVLNP